MAESDLDTSSWSAFEVSLRAHLAHLGDDQFVSISDRPLHSAPGPKPGLLSRLFGRRALFDGGVYVQTRRSDEYLYVECVGSRSFGGRHAWTPEQEADLEALGWVHRPELIGEKVYVIGTDAPDLNGHVRIGEAGLATRLMVATLREVARVASPVTLDVGLG